MSEAVEHTAAGATRGFFGSLAFILLMVGIEGMTGAADLPPGLGPMLIVVGGICAYAAFFWESAKKVLSPEVQAAIGRFSQSRITWFGMLYLILVTIILSPFVEKHRWPFSFPADPAVYAENAGLHSALAGMQMNLDNAMPDARRWRFAYNLKNQAKAVNGERLICKFSLLLSRGNGAQKRWINLQRMLDMAGWQNVGTATPDDEFQGISVSVGPDSSEILPCAVAFGPNYESAYPGEHIALRTDHVSPALVGCKNKCVELDIGN